MFYYLTQCSRGCFTNSVTNLLTDSLNHDPPQESLKCSHAYMPTVRARKLKLWQNFPPVSTCNIQNHNKVCVMALKHFECTPVETCQVWQIEYFSMHTSDLIFWTKMEHIIMFFCVQKIQKNLICFKKPKMSENYYFRPFFLDKSFLKLLIK